MNYAVYAGGDDDDDDDDDHDGDDNGDNECNLPNGNPYLCNNFFGNYSSGLHSI
jgi:hypothetical protein